MLSKHDDLCYVSFLHRIFSRMLLDRRTKHPRSRSRPSLVRTPSITLSVPVTGGLYSLMISSIFESAFPEFHGYGRMQKLNTVFWEYRAILSSLGEVVNHWLDESHNRRLNIKDMPSPCTKDTCGMYSIHQQHNVVIVHELCRPSTPLYTPHVKLWSKIGQRFVCLRSCLLVNCSAISLPNEYWLQNAAMGKCIAVADKPDRRIVRLSRTSQPSARFCTSYAGGDYSCIGPRSVSSYIGPRSVSSCIGPRSVSIIGFQASPSVLRSSHHAVYFYFSFFF
jgi:hypothetical protein